MAVVETQAGGAPAPPSSLLRALRHVLRPLVHLLLRHQITYPLLTNLLKSVYADVAEREFALAGKPQTTSRISLLTGLHRKDVRRLRDESAEEDPTPQVISLGAQLVARWTGVSDYLDEQGRPIPLPRLSRDGGASFESLVASVSKDIRSRAVLDEWRRLGIAQLDADDRVLLSVDAFVPESGFDEKAHFFGRNLHDHLAAAAHNLSGEGAPMLERSVYYDDLSQASVDELGKIAEKLGMQALQAVNRRARELQERDAARADARLRINFGVYFLRAIAADEPASDEEGDD